MARHNGSQASPKDGSSDTSQITGEQIPSPTGAVPVSGVLEDVPEARTHAASDGAADASGEPAAMTPCPPDGTGSVLL